MQFEDYGCREIKHNTNHNKGNFAISFGSSKFALVRTQHTEPAQQPWTTPSLQVNTVFRKRDLEWNFFGRAQTINCKFKFIQLLFAAAHLAPLMGVISHALSITAPLSHTGTTYRPQVLIKGKKERKEKQLTSAVEKWANALCHTSDPRVKVQMKEWSLSVARYPVIRSMQLPPSALTCVRRQAFFPFFFFFLSSSSHHSLPPVIGSVLLN